MGKTLLTKYMVKCKWKDCKKKLSTYNKNEYCFVHLYKGHSSIEDVPGHYPAKKYICQAKKCGKAFLRYSVHKASTNKKYCSECTMERRSIISRNRSLTRFYTESNRPVPQKVKDLLKKLDE